ncbi:pyruvate kinase [Diachasma alloeum]|uniref:pyruvate kinase n=1 Tax=Diachasma alloeum TaxID=454923 RepID=UPI0007383B84|nr:pyruvate kinase [Diachasma alloeum]
MGPHRQLCAAKLSVNCRPRPARLTGIMVTLGENNSAISDIMALLSKNVDIVRLNVSHKDLKWHETVINNLRTAIDCLSARAGVSCYPPAVALDLPGPEIRVGALGTQDVRLSVGDEIKIFTEGNAKTIRDIDGIRSFGICYPDLPRISQIGNKIVLDRGSVCLEINEIEGTIHRNMIVQPIDSPSNIPGFCKRDDEALKLALALRADFLILSPVPNGKAVAEIKDRIRKSGNRPICLLSKISSSQGLDNFDEILKLSDGILIDRESLQIVVGTEELCLAQKSMIAKCNRVGKAVVITYRVPNDSSTKLNLDSVANAVSEGVDTIFLATGALNVKNTIKLIGDVDLVSREAESARWLRKIPRDLSYKTTTPLDPSHGMAMAAAEMSAKLNASGIIVTTTTGRTAMLLSIYRPPCPIVAVTRYGIAARWLRLYFAVHSIHYRCPPHPDWNQDLDCRVERAMNYLRQWKYIDTGDPVIVVSGWRRDQGFTHSIRLVYVTPAAFSKGSEDFEDTW